MSSYSAWARGGDNASQSWSSGILWLWGKQAWTALVSPDSKTDKAFGWSTDACVKVWTAPATGTYRLTPDKAIYGGKTLLARFRFIVTVT